MRLYFISISMYIMLANKLKKGDTIGIIAPSKPINKIGKIEVNNFTKYMNSLDINIKLSKNLYKQDKYNTSGGTPEERADDINTMFSDPDIQAIWCLQGGELANQTLDLIDFENIKQNPKIFLGKSDIDLLLLAINKITGLITFHSCDSKIGRGKEMDFNYTKQWFQKRLWKGQKEIEASEEWTCIQSGKSKGKLLGCNISSILKLAGTKYFPNFENSILFIESYRADIGKIIYQITQLEQIGIFKEIKGIVIGHNFDFQSEKFTVEGIIKDLLGKYNFPILKINEFGHYQPHTFLPIGSEIKLDATNKKITIMDNFLL